MATLELRFRENIIDRYHCDRGIVTIGRDPDNTIRIDSLAVAPKHASLDLDDPEGPCLRRETPDSFPLHVNGKPIDRCRLHDGDVIGLGKHTLSVSLSPRSGTEPHSPAEIFTPPKEAVLQFLNGKHIGRVVPLKHAMTRLGQRNGIAVIARRKSGYFLSPLGNERTIRINGAPLGNRTVALRHGDIIEIDDGRMMFCSET